MERRTTTPRVICVLGMHRSGTSLAARLINLLGIELGAVERLTAPAPDNPRGYWEHAALTRLNDEILTALGGSWDEPPPPPADWDADPRLTSLRQAARALIDREFGDTACWAWKDPRNCLTLPFWRPHLPPLRHVLCLRNPVDVARSLERRNGFSFAKSQDLWLRYVAAALANTSGHPRFLLFYEDLMADWSTEMRRLDRFLGTPQRGNRRGTRTLMAAFIEDTLHHHQTNLPDVMDEPHLAFPALAVYAALRSFGARGKETALDALSRHAVRASADAAHRQVLVAALRSRQADQERMLEALGGQLGEAQTEATRLREELMRRDQTFHALELRGTTEREQMTHEIAARAAERDREREAAAERLAVTQARLAAITGSRAYAVMRIVWRILAVIAPRGSRRERWLHLAPRQLSTDR